MDRIAVLLSGTGRTLDNIMDSIGRGELRARVVTVISSRAGVRGNDVARRHGLPLAVLPRRDFDGASTFSDAVFAALDEAGPELVICAGFLSLLHVPGRYEGRIINIHPSLLPLFGGRGFYGDRVHRAALESGMKVSGCTSHFVDNEYDAGPIIAQRCVPVRDADTVESLAQRVFAAECELYPRVIQRVLDGEVRLDGRIVRGFDDG